MSSNRHLAFALLLLSSCTPQTTLIGPSYPPREEGCSVALYPSSLPDFPYREIATGMAQCGAYDRDWCIQQFRTEACRIGAHAVFGFNEFRVDQEHSMTASFARRTEPSPQTARSGAPAATSGAGAPKAAASDAPAEATAGRAATTAASASKPEAPVRPVAERLKELQDLKEKGLITEEEYAERRAAILESI